MFALALPLTPQRAAKVVAEEIARLHSVLARTPITDPGRADILLRLGEAYEEQRRAAAADGRANARASAASAALVQWRAIYNDKRYRQYARLDEALFDGAWLLHEENGPSEAQPLFQRILDELPRSKFVPNAALARGEEAFEASDMKGALRYYERILAYPSHVVFGYANYKIAWAHYNLGEGKDAVDAFTRISILERTASSMRAMLRCSSKNAERTSR
jgi:tetratricopeptide (TPR) repeat protein